MQIRAGPVVETGHESTVSSVDSLAVSVLRWPSAIEEYHGKSKVGEIRILIPNPSGTRGTAYQWHKERKRFRRRAGVEPIIGHLKFNFRMIRNYLKGSAGDSINLMLAAAAIDFKKWVREIAELILSFMLHLCLLRLPDRCSAENE